MAFAAAHLYLTMHGTVTNLSAIEQWQVGLRIATQEALFSPAQMQGYVEAARDDVNEWWVGSTSSGIRSLYVETTTLDYVKLARIGANGLYTEDEATTADIAAGTRAGAKTGPLPLPAQLAVAVTLTTDAARGLASKGRIYLPAPAADALGNTGGISLACRTLMGDKTATLLDDLNNMPGIDTSGFPWTCSVFSRVGAGVTRTITGVQVGERFDSQRRRAEKFPETPLVSSVGID